MDINKTVTFICVVIVLYCCWAWSRKERFIPMPLTDPTKELDKGISNNLEQTQPNANPNAYYKEMTHDVMNTLLQRTIDRKLQSQLKDRIGEPPLSLAYSKDMVTLTSEYVTTAINSLLPPSNKPFKVVRSKIAKVRTIDNVDLYTLHVIIHRESKQIGYSLKVDVAVKLSDSQVIGITDIKAFGYMSEDVLLMKQGYDWQTVQSDALSVDHTITKPPQFEQAILYQQSDGLFKDRGIKANNPL